MNHGDAADPSIRQFRVSHSSASYLCSYQGCPRASQGFGSLELRQQHEESHAPRFQCSNAACGFWQCNSKAALRKHIAKYHDDYDVSSVPDYLDKTLREKPQEKSLFRLSGSRMTSSMYRGPEADLVANVGSLGPESNDYQEQLALLERDNKLRLSRNVGSPGPARLDYQQQLMQLEKDNKHRLLLLRQEQDASKDRALDTQVYNAAESSAGISYKYPFQQQQNHQMESTLEGERKKRQTRTRTRLIKTRTRPRLIENANGTPSRQRDSVVFESFEDTSGLSQRREQSKNFHLDLSQVAHIGSGDKAFVAGSDEASLSPRLSDVFPSTSDSIPFAKENVTTFHPRDINLPSFPLPDSYPTPEGTHYKSPFAPPP